jgi:hypothetical protein
MKMTDPLKKMRKDMKKEPGEDSTQFDAPKGTLVRDSRKPKLSHAAKLVKEILLKSRGISEEMYDKDKTDKDTTKSLKKPKLDIADDEKEGGDKKSQAKAVLSGGRTMTGQDRDTVEFYPMLRGRPGQPDPSKKEDKDKDKKKKEDK